MTSLKKFSAIFLLTAILLSCPLASIAAEFTVGVTTFTIDVDPGDGVCEDSSGNCSLYAAFMEANANGEDDVIRIDLVTASVPFYLDSHIAVVSKITLIGQGISRSSTIDGQDATRCFIVHQAGDLTISRCTVQNGRVDSEDYPEDGGAFAAIGGGKLYVTDCTVANNESADFNGGAFYVGPISYLKIDNGSRIVGNRALRAGGAIYNEGTVEISGNTQFVGN